MRGLTLSLLAAAADAAKWPLRAPHADSVPATFDCAMRKAAYDFGRKLIPRQGGFESLFYALDLNDPNCQGKFAEPLVEATASKPDPIPPDAVFVSPSGTRGATGKPDAPLRSIPEAADLAVASGRRTIVLRGGTHYLSAPIALGAPHDRPTTRQPAATMREHGGDSSRARRCRDAACARVPHIFTGGAEPVI